MNNINELTAKLKAAAQEEIMCRESCDTSDLWQDEASPENILAITEALEAAQSHIAELEARTLTVKLPDDGMDDCYDLWGPEHCRNTFDCGYNFSAVRHEEAIREACERAGIALLIEGE